MPQSHFLSRVLPSLAPPDFFGATPTYFSIGLNTAANARDQKAWNNIPAVVSHCNACSTAGLDAYMALASFYHPLGGRRKDKALECRSIWADLDCGPGKPYPDAEHGLAALLAFGQKTGLEPTVIVGSGRGIHAYWTFDKNIAAQVWLQIASLFHQLCVQEGLDVDPTRAKDLSSVLRLPGTIHQKSGATVRLLVDTNTNWSPKAFVQQIGHKLRTAQAPVPVALPAQHIQAPTTPLAQYLGVAPEPPKADAEKIARNCPQMLTMGMGLYPQWFAGMTVLKRCVDGLAWAHRLSAFDPSRYDPAVCEKKFYDAADNAPARCSTFEMANPALCQTCVHRGRITSPVQLTNVSPPPVVVQDTPANSVMGAALGYPTQLTRGDNTQNFGRMVIADGQWLVDSRGIVQVESKKDANGTWKIHENVICAAQIYFKYTSFKDTDGKPKTVHYFEVVYPNGTKRTIAMVAAEDKTEFGITRWLANADINPNGHVTNIGKVFMSFFNAYLASVAVHKPIVPMVEEFGWTKYTDPGTKQKIDGFVIGDGIITEHGMKAVEHDAGASGMFAKETFACSGTLEEWKHVPRMYTVLNQKLGEFGICCSLAAPLMRYGIGEAKNAYLNVFSPEGGKGKSTLARAAFSVWGNPEHAFGSPNASLSQRGKALSVYNNLPFIVDEITRMKDDDMQSMVYILAGGKDKDRLTSKAELTKTGSWATYTMSTANRSVKEALSRVTGDTDATLLRVIEYECDFSDYDGQPKIQEYISACSAVGRMNYGLAGPEFMHHLLQNSHRLVTLTQVLDNWRIKNGIKDSERYLASGIGLAIIAARWAVEWGILDIDVDALERWALDVLIPFNRANTANLAPDFVNLLGEYLNSRQPDTLMVRRDVRNSKEPDPRSLMVPDAFVILRPIGREIKVRYEYENEVLKIASGDFKLWCSNRGLSDRVMLNNLAKKGITIDREKTTLTNEVSWLPMTRMRCLVLRKDTLHLLGFTPPLPAPAPAPAQMPVDNIHTLSTG